VSAPTWLSAGDQESLVSIGECADALAVVLHEVKHGSSPRDDPPRSALDLGIGQLLVMPSTSTGHVGVKLVTVADPMADVDGPRIQGVHVQFDALTLAPKAILDGIALTNLRTAAVSILALRSLAVPSSAEMIVFGAGPQARSHARAVAAEWPLRRIRVASRTRETAQQCVDDLARGLPGIDIVPLAPEDVEGAVPLADIIVCATTAETPVFDSLPRDGAAIVAVGSHSPRQRELPGPLMKRAYVVVEDRETALREAGDIVLAIDDGLLTREDIDADLGELVRGARVDVAGPRVFKSVGMAWQDAVVADAIFART
jgi:ornithine cyclodeaminase